MTLPDENILDAFMLAAWNGDLATVERLHRSTEGGEWLIFARQGNTTHGATALLLACEKGSCATVKYLVDHGGHELVNTRGSTIYDEFIVEGAPRICKQIHIV
jgi:ankyrin repeat protein